MSLKNSIYILECIPKNESSGEGTMLNEFLKIILQPNKFNLEHIKGKYDFFDKLNKNNSKIVHISCHGYWDKKGICIKVPRGGEIKPESFRLDDKLKGRNIIITGCDLGKEKFARKLLERTEANPLIAPLGVVDSFDVAMWCVNFYYRLLNKNLHFNKCYNYMKKNFRISGAMIQWE